MNCSRCQLETPSDAEFCPECGTKLSVPCAQCGTANAATHKFCKKCGHSLGSVAAEGWERAGVRAPQSYTPKYLAERILSLRSALEGERKQVTVLFADLKGSMELLADRDPEEARKILDPVLGSMMDGVHRYEGTVNQVMGDGIMALFGAPLAHEDHAVRACYSALRMQESVKKYAEEARRTHAAVVNIRVGLNSGEVVVRTIGSDLRMDYTAVGQTTHLAARMEQVASPGTVVIAPATLALVEGYVEVKPLGPVPIKGLADAVEVYEVTGAGSARTRFQASARRGLTRFVGRDAELEQLRRAQQLVGAGHGQVTAIVGEAGVGKSRLVYEFTHSHRLQGWLILEAPSVSYGKATSYCPVIDLLKGYFKIQDRDDLREIREKVTGKLLTLDRALEPTVPALLSLLDVPVDDETWSRLDPPQRRQRTLGAVKALLLREARAQPLLLIFEDLHWIDGETQAVLDGVVDSLGWARLLLLVSYRPDYQHTWGNKTYYGQMRLDALTAESTAELLDALLGDDPDITPLKQLLTRRGNPFFLEETVRTLVETKILVGERGRYRLTQRVQTLQVPATVQAVLAARVDRLGPDDKRLLQVAAVVGKDVPFALLQATAELPEEPLRRGLEHLQAAEFLYETGLYTDLEYSFTHALTHEVTYGGVLQERRRDLHARIVGAIETLHRDRLGEHVERLAHHAWHGDLWDKAMAYGRQAGAKAIARSAHTQAVSFFDGALEALEHLPEDAQISVEAIDLRLDRHLALRTVQPAKGLAVLREAEVLATTLGDQRRLALILCSIGMSLGVAAEFDDAIAVGTRAVDIATTLGDVSLEALARTRLGQTYYRVTEYSRAVDLLRHAYQSDPGSSHGAYGAGAYLTISLPQLGRFAEGTSIGEALLQFATASNQPTLLLQAYACLGYLHREKGDLDRAIPLLERGVEVSRTWKLSMGWDASIMTNLGRAYQFTGRGDEALPLLERAIELYEARGDLGVLPLHLGRLSEGYLLAGRLAQAYQCAQRTLDLSRRQKQRGSEAAALHCLGTIASSLDVPDAEKAEGHYHEAMALSIPLGMRPLVAHCHLALGKLSRRIGKREQAREHLATATTMYREMEMTYWVEKTKAELQ